MHVAFGWSSVARGARMGMGAALCGGMLLTVSARGSDIVPAIDMHLVADLEQRAGAADRREQAFLYAELADKMTLLASRQIADGELEKAEETLHKLEACTAKMESNFAQSKSLKKTEIMLHMTHRRLNDMARAASYDMKPHVQDALKRLNAAQTSLLAVLFAK